MAHMRLAWDEAKSDVTKLAVRTGGVLLSAVAAAIFLKAGHNTASALFMATSAVGASDVWFTSRGIYRKMFRASAPQS
ncbi:MAG: hypothetical protein WBK91_11050 [Alphaproteobacteria bacterium]